MSDTLNNIKELAVKAYDAYTAAVGGVNYKGEPLPKGEEFFADPGKAKQAEGWIAAVNATKKDVFTLANTLPQKEHGQLIGALAAYHAATWGKEYLPEKARTWLQRHEWVRTVAIAILALIAAWGLNSCTYTSSQVAADGSTAQRYWAIDAATARDLVKLYGVPQVPSVNVTK